MAELKALWLQRLIVLLLALILLIISSTKSSPGVVYEGDGLYSHYKVVNTTFRSQPTRLLLTDKLSIQSGIYLNNTGVPLYDYNARIDEILAQKKPKKVLLIGGGSYTLPTLMADRYPLTRIDIIEIDPKLDNLAIKYFDFSPRNEVRIYHEDGRTYVNRSDEKYDVIVVDAFLTLSPPFQLTTVEAIRNIKKNLANDGIVAVNIISAVEGPKSKFIKSEYLTYQQVFSEVQVLQATAKLGKTNVQNIVLLAGTDKQLVRDIARKNGGRPFLANTAGSKVLTDDFAPVETMTRTDSN